MDPSKRIEEKIFTHNNNDRSAAAKKSLAAIGVGGRLFISPKKLALIYDFSGEYVTTGNITNGGENNYRIDISSSPDVRFNLYNSYRGDMLQNTSHNCELTSYITQALHALDTHLNAWPSIM